MAIDVYRCCVHIVHIRHHVDEVGGGTVPPHVYIPSGTYPHVHIGIAIVILVKTFVYYLKS